MLWKTNVTDLDLIIRYPRNKPEYKGNIDKNIEAIESVPVNINKNITIIEDIKADLIPALRSLTIVSKTKIDEVIIGKIGLKTTADKITL